MQFGLAPLKSLQRQVAAAGLHRPLQSKGNGCRSGWWHLFLVDHGVMVREPGQATDLGSRDGHEMGGHPSLCTLLAPSSACPSESAPCPPSLHAPVSSAPQASEPWTFLTHSPSFLTSPALGCGTQWSAPQLYHFCATGTCGFTGEQLELGALLEMLDKFLGFC